MHASVVQTQACNIYSIPTDCPQREKRGWMGVSPVAYQNLPALSDRQPAFHCLLCGAGDAQWTAEEALLNFDMYASSRI